MSQSRILAVELAPLAPGCAQAVGGHAALVRVSESLAAHEQLSASAWDLVLLSAADLAAIEPLAGMIRKLDSQVPIVAIVAQPATSAAPELRTTLAALLPATTLPDELAALVQRLLAARRNEAERELLLRQFERPYTFDEFIGASPAMRRVFDTIVQVADSDVDVLIVGATGTGKELVARSIHRRSRRAEHPFVPVDCGAIPEGLMESEFFGHERGAFTGAQARQIGLVEFADGGTLFLDELGELPLLMQAKLLRTLQERKIRRVGGRDETDVDVRILAATSRDLPEMIRQGRFREDLYYRINVVQIELPPLADRGDDVGLLAEYFATRASRDMRRPLTGITPEAFQVLRQYHWPGNVRELQNVIRRGVALSQIAMLGLEDLPDGLVTAAGRNAPQASRGYFKLRDQHMERFERDYLEELLRRHQGDVKNAAQEALLPRGTLYRLMKAHGLESGQFRRG